MASRACPCGSGLDYGGCCEPFHRGHRQAELPERLMRSRYSAYVLAHWAYVHRTWHENTRPALQALITGEHPRWLGLEVLHAASSAHVEIAYVEFRAHFIHQGNAGVLHENSLFHKENACWYYLQGEIIPEQGSAVDKVGRNSPCPCGSGRKFKRCCQ